MNPVEAFDGCADTAVHPDKVRLASANAPDANEIARVSAVFKLLGDPTRTRLLYALLEAGELCVCDLAAATGTAEATVSQALRLLRASGVVIGRREGRNIFYRLSDAHAATSSTTKNAATRPNATARRQRCRPVAPAWWSWEWLMAATIRKHRADRSGRWSTRLPAHPPPRGRSRTAPARGG